MYGSPVSFFLLIAQIMEVSRTVVVLGEDFQQHVRPLIDFIDTLRDLGIEKDVPIPQIAVMGDQSSGKSSVLEALLRRDY